MRGLFVLVLALVAFVPGAARAEPARMALVIGNGAYVGEGWSPLANPRVDANNVSRALRNRGYQVTTLTDLGRAAMLNALDRFGEQVLALERGSVAIVYYAGHGYAVGSNNYIVPIDANGVSNGAAMVGMDSFLAAFGRASGVATIAIFDSCRNTPDGARGEPSGFVRVERPNSFIAFSADFGSAASDGGEGLGSAFGNAFANLFEFVPGLTPDQLLGSVRSQVAAATGGQVPVSYSNLRDQVRINGEPATPSDRRLSAAYILLLDNLQAEAWDLAVGAAQQGNAEAMLLAGALAFQGVEGHPRDERTTLAWLARAMDRGAQRGRLAWARTAAFSPVSRQAERDRAMQILRQLSAAGDPEALYAFGFANYGRNNPATAGLRFSNFEPSLIVATDSFRRAADAGSVDAAIAYGMMLYAGATGVPPNREVGVNYLRRAAWSGSARAMVMFGNAISTYRNGPRDAERDQRAVRWYRQAARSNDPEALLRLSIAYMFGIGVPQDRAQAARYLVEAERAITPVRETSLNTAAQIESYARSFRSGQPLVEPPCRLPNGCNLVSGFGTQ